MADKNNAAVQALMEHIQSKLQEYVGEGKKITVTLKEDSYDLFDEYNHADYKKGVSINEKQYKDYLINSQAQDIKTISFDLETSYMGFHYYAWKELSLVEKTITVLWFNQLLAKRSKKDAAPVILNPYIKDTMDHSYSKEMEDYCLTINPLKLQDSNRLGYQFLEELMFYNFQDDLNLAMTEINEGVNKERFDKMVIANCLKPVERPENYQSYLYGEDISEEEEKQIALYSSQPIEMARREMIKEMTEYMQECQEVIGVADTDWQLYDSETDDFNGMLDALFENHFKEDRQKVFEKYLKKELVFVNKMINSTEELEK